MGADLVVKWQIFGEERHNERIAMLSTCFPVNEFHSPKEIGQTKLPGDPGETHQNW